MSPAAERRDAALRRLRRLTATTVAVAALSVGALTGLAAATKPGSAPRPAARRDAPPPPAASDDAPRPPVSAPEPAPAPPVVTSGGS